MQAAENKTRYLYRNVSIAQNLTYRGLTDLFNKTTLGITWVMMHAKL